MIPAAYIGAYMGGVHGVFAAMAIVNAGSGIVIHFWSRQQFHKGQRTLGYLA